MKIKAIIFFLLLLTTVGYSFGQDKTGPLLVDEFGMANCDDILSRVDHFFLTLHNSPGTHGVFSITGDNSELVEILNIEQTLRVAIFQRRYNSESVTFLRTSSAKPIKVQFWLTKNVTFPTSELQKLSAKFPVNFSPFNIRNDMSQICDPEPLEPLTSELSGENPEGQIIVVVNYASPREKNQQLNEAIKMLKIYPRSRVRYLFRRDNGGWNDYWLVYGRPSVSTFYKRLRQEQAWSY